MNDLLKLSKRAMKLLSGIYLKRFVCETQILAYSTTDKSIKARMCAPAVRYTRRKITELTGIQYLMAVSQLVYVFIDFLINDGAAEMVSEEEMAKLLNSKFLPWYLRWRLRLMRSHARRQEYLFEILMDHYKLKFRRLEMKFGKILAHDESFEIEMRLKTVRRSSKGIPLIVVEIGGPVLEGEILNMAIVGILPKEANVQEKAQ